MTRLIHDNRSIALANTSMAAADSVGYTVNFVNNSNNAGTAYMFQTDPSATAQNASSLAWFSYPSNVGVVNTFLWSIDYSVFWSSTANLVPGVVVTSSQTLPCGVTSNNQTTLSRNDFGYYLSAPVTGSPSGSIIILQDSKVVSNTASIGIGMSGAGTFAVPAQPNITALFTPNPTYWISFSLAPVKKGTVLITQSTNSQMIQFPPGMTTCTATLSATNSWSVEYSL